MNQRVFALWLACAAQALALTLPAGRAGPAAHAASAGAGRPAARPPTPVRARPTTSWRWSIPNPSPTTRCARAWPGSSSSWRSRASRCRRAPEFARQVLERLISEKAQLQLARESGIKVDEAAVDQAEQNVARQNQIDVAELRRRLAADGMTLSQFRDELRNQLLLTRLRERELEPRVKVTDLEVDQYIREQPGQQRPVRPANSTSPTSWWRCPKTPPRRRSPSLQAKAQRLQERARAGEDFAKLVARAIRCARRRRQRRPGGPAHRRPLSAAVRPGRPGAAGRRRQRDRALGRRLSRDQGDREAARRTARRHGGAKPRPPHPVAAQRRS